MPAKKTVKIVGICTEQFSSFQLLCVHFPYTTKKHNLMAIFLTKCFHLVIYFLVKSE